MNKSFGITIRPKNGSFSGLEDNIKNYCVNFNHQIVAEKEGVNRHLHLQLWFDSERKKSHVKQAFTRILEKYDWWDQDHKRHCIKCKLCYNDWIQEYCLEHDSKGDPYELISCDIPEVTSSYYPSEEEQKKLMDKSNSMNLRLYTLKELYEGEIKRENVARFLAKQFYVEDKFSIPPKKIDRINLCNNLYMYLRAHMDKPNIELIGDEFLAS